MTSKRKVPPPPGGDTPFFTSTKLSSALIHEGTFVEYRNESDNIAAGQVVGTYGQKLKIRRYSFGRNPNHTAIVTGIGANLSELIQESVDDTAVIEDNDLKEFAFVFKPCELEERACWLQGITNSYVFQHDHRGEDVVFDSFPPRFP